MRIVYISILVLLTQLNSNGQTLPTQKEQYNFLSWYLKIKNLKTVLNTTTSFSIGSLSKKYIDQVLSSDFKIDKTGRTYINRQILKSNNPVVLDTSLFKDIDWKKGIDSNNFKSYSAIKSYISVPIFSLNRKMVFITWGYYCGGTCGKESIDTYIKTKRGKWKKVFNTFPIVVF